MNKHYFIFCLSGFHSIPCDMMRTVLVALESTDATIFHVAHIHYWQASLSTSVICFITLMCLPAKLCCYGDLQVFVSNTGHKQGLDLVCSFSYNIILISIQSSFEVFISNIICNSAILTMLVSSTYSPKSEKTNFTHL